MPKELIFAALVACSFACPVNAQGLSGPSSVEADLEPGDGLTDPQFRSDFPRNIAPGYFDWKDSLAESGLSFNLDYLALGQTSNADIGAGDASSGIFRVYGNWKATDNGSLTFKVENRHKFGDVAPQDFGFDSGALSVTGTAFNDNDTLLTNLFWTQRAGNGAWTLQFGQIDVTDFLDVYGLVSPYTAFQNLSFNTNPTINAPNPGLGIAGGAKLGPNVYVVGSIADANADPSSPDLHVFSDGELFKSLEIGYTSGFDRIYFDNVHFTFWHADAADDGNRREDYGATFSAAWFVENKWMPFLRAGTSKGRAALYENSISAGLGYFARNTDLAGIGLNWAEADGISGDQKTIEVFYRYSVSRGLQVTPSVQYIRDPLLNSSASNVTLWGLRARVVF